MRESYQKALSSFLSVLAVLLTLEALRQDVLAFQSGEIVDTGVLRFVRTVLCFAVSVSIAGFRIRFQEILLPLALLIAVVADYFLILEDNLKIGIGIFAIMQMVLTMRHLIGVRFKQLKNRVMLLAVTIGLVVLLIGNGLLWTSLEQKGLAIPVLIYSSLLSVSTVVAFATRFNLNFSKTSSGLAFYGMILFMLCDITVGVGAAFGHTSVGQLVRASTGLFYTPSLLLLGWSGFVSKKA